MRFGQIVDAVITVLIQKSCLLSPDLIIGIICGVSSAINSGYQSRGPLFRNLFFAIWVIVHLYPFLKCLTGPQNRIPTIVIVWSVLLASIFSFCGTGLTRLGRIMYLIRLEVNVGSIVRYIRKFLQKFLKFDIYVTRTI